MSNPDPMWSFSIPCRISLEISTTIFQPPSRIGSGKVGLGLEEAAQLAILLAMVGGWVEPTHLKKMRMSNWIISPRGEKKYVKPPPSADE